MNITRRTKAVLVSQLALFSTISFCIGAARAEKVLAGHVCTERIHNLTQEITWNHDLDDALAKAKQDNKLVLWIHMLGKIDGDT